MKISGMGGNHKPDMFIQCGMCISGWIVRHSWQLGEFSSE